MKTAVSLSAGAAYGNLQTESENFFNVKQRSGRDVIQSVYDRHDSK
jgi:hypothetical protein